MFFISWPNAALLRFGREEWNQRKSLGKTLSTRLVLYTAGVGSVLVIAFLLNSSATRFLDMTESPFSLIAAGIILAPLAEIGIYANQATGRPISYGLTPLISQIIFLSGILLIPVLYVTADIKYLIFWFLTGAMFSAVTAIIILPRNVWHSFRPDRTVMSNILRYSWALPFGAIASYTVNWVDAWVIRAYMDTFNVGIYTWAYQITMIGSLAFPPLAVILAPYMIDARLSGDIDELSQHGYRSLRVVVLAGIAGTVLLGLVYPVLSTVVGSHYMQAYMIILILLSAIPFQLLGYLITPISNAFEFLIPRKVLISIGIAISNVFGDLILVPLMGISGAAVATWGVFFVGGIIQVYIVMKYVPKISFPSLLSFSIGSLLMSVGVLGIWMSGPVAGTLLCFALSITALMAARRIRLFSESDAQWLEAQPIADIIKRPLVLFAKWLVYS